MLALLLCFAFGLVAFPTLLKAAPAPRIVGHAVAGPEAFNIHYETTSFSDSRNDNGDLHSDGRPSQHLPLRAGRHLIDSSGYVDMARLQLIAEHERSKHSLRLSGHPSLKRGDILLNDFELDVTYLGEVTIGNQTFPAMFDTGSSDMFVAGPDCVQVHGSDGCAGSARYRNSTESEGPSSILRYGTTTVEGDLYTDTVAVGPFSVSEQSLVSVSRQQFSSVAPWGALVGMGFPSLSANHKAPWFDSLVRQDAARPAADRSLQASEFSFYFGRESDGTGNDSLLSIGTRDASKFTGEFSTHPLVSAGVTQGIQLWAIHLSAVAVDGRSSGPVGNGLAIVDSGSTLMQLPVDTFLQMATAIPGAVVAYSGGDPKRMFYPCNTADHYMPTMQFGDANHPVNPKDLMLGKLSADDFYASNVWGLDRMIQDAEYCVASIMATAPTDQSSLLGDAFLKNYYTVFNRESSSISFAKAI